MISKKSVIKINDIMMYLAVAIQHLRLMALLICFSMLLGLVYYSFSKPVYESKTLIHLEVLQHPLNSDTVLHDSGREAVRIGLNAPPIVERTAAKLGVTASDRELRKKYFKKFDIQFDSEYNLIVSFYPFSYEWATNWTPTLVNEYLSYREEKRTERIRSIIATYASDINDMQKKMDDLFTKRYAYRQDNRLTGLRIELDDLKQVPVDLTVAKYRLAKMDNIREELKNQIDPVAKLSKLALLDTDQTSNFRDLQMRLGGTVPNKSEGAPPPAPIIVMPGNLPAAEKNWQILDRKAREVQQSIDKLSITYKQGYHEIRKLTKELVKIKQDLELVYQTDIKNFELSYTNLLNEKTELERKVPIYDEAMQRFEKLQIGYTYLDANQLNWREYMTTMQKKLEAIDFVSDKERTLLSYVGPIETIRDFPVSPNRLRIFVFSLMIGLALAIAIPFLIAYLDNSVSDVEHVEESLHIRGLGVVPRIDESAINNLLISGINAKPAAKPEYHLQENFRIIRTNLIMHADSPNHLQVILVTSAMPQEGKTVVSANLAMSFATKGEKTLLIDGDLRRGRLHRLFGCQNKPGLSDVLSKYNTIADACRPSGNENLTIMTCGKHLNWASELLDTPGFIKLMEDLRGQYQRIIIDTPPVLGLSETSIMQRFSDGVVMVIWSGHTQMPSIKDAVSALQTNGAKFSGFVLNRLDFSAFANRYKYFYYSPRYYTNYKAIEASSIAGAES